MVIGILFAILHLSMTRFFVGLFMIAGGIFLVWKTEWMIRGFGRSQWAEMKLGAGGTWTLYKIVGVLVILLAFFIMSGKIFNILDFVFHP